MKELKTLNILGTVQAGFTSLAEEGLADTITVGEYLIRDKEASYILEVDSSVMEEAGILNGDKVIFERGKIPKFGDIVITLTDEGYGIRFYKKNSPFEGEVIGVVTATFRTYK